MRGRTFSPTAGRNILPPIRWGGYWQAEGDAMQAYFAHLKYDASGARMFNELALRQRVIMRSYRGVRSTNNRHARKRLKE